jgi:hypothetical protein
MQSQVYARERERRTGRQRGSASPQRETRAPAAPSPLASGSDRAILIVALAALMLHAILAWLARPAGLETSQDAATYFVLGQSILQGGYQELFRTDAPVHALYPPVYPFQLAVLQGLFGDHLAPMMAWGVLCSVATLGMVFLLMRRYFSPMIGLATLCLLAVNPILVELATQLRAETSFMMLATTSVFFLSGREPTKRGTIIGCAAAILGALTRTAGVVILPAVAVHLFLLGRRRTLFAFIIAASLTVGSWLTWTTLAPEKYVGRSYVADALTLVGMADSTGVTSGGQSKLTGARMVRRTLYYGGMGIPWSLQMPTITGTRADNAVGAALLGVLILVGAWTARRQWRIAVLGLGFYAALLFVWTWQAQRFLAPVVPMLAALLVLGGATVLRRYTARFAVPVAAALLLPFVLTGATRTTQAISERPNCDRDGLPPAPACMTGDDASYLAAVAYIRSNVSKDAVFLTLKPAPFYAYTGITSVGQGPVLAQSPETFADFLAENGVTHVLLGHLHTHEPRRLLSRLEGMCDRLVVEQYFPPRTFLLKLGSAGADPDDTAACEALARYRVMSNES